MTTTAERNSGVMVSLLDEDSVSRWDAYVTEKPEGTFFHRAGWKIVIEQSLKHRCYFYFAERDGNISGVLPLVHVKSTLFGNSLISTGFTVGGGPLCDDDATLAELNARATSLADKLDVDYIEYRCRESGEPGWTMNGDLYVNFSKEIDPDPEREMLAIPRKQRAMVRKGIKVGLQSTIDDDVERLHAIYAESVRNLGTPVFPKGFFRCLHSEFGPDVDIVTIEHEGVPVSSVMNFYFRDRVLPYYGGGTAAARAVAGNDFLYWEVMRRAIERGYRVFDYGRSKRETGSYAFKKNWGFKPEPLNYRFKLRKLDSLPEISPSNPKFRLFIAAWKRLPLPISKFAGPLISRNLG